MKKRLTEEQLRAKIKRTPLWMQDIANAALKDRDNAKAELAGYLAAQKPGPFYEEQYSTEGRTRRYFDAKKMTVVHAGIELEIRIDAMHHDGKAIRLRYGREESLTCHDIALLPSGSNTIELRAVENMDTRWAEIQALRAKAKKKAKGR